MTNVFGEKNCLGLDFFELKKQIRSGVFFSFFAMKELGRFAFFGHGGHYSRAPLLICLYARKIKAPSYK
jgi:hypothetical protein